MALARSDPDALTSEILMQAKIMNEIRRVAYEAGYMAGYRQGLVEMNEAAKKIVHEVIAENKEAL